MFFQCKINYLSFKLLVVHQWSPLWEILLLDLHIYVFALVSALTLIFLGKKSFIYLPTGMGWICSRNFIFRKCVVRYLWYLLMLDSRTCPIWSSWGSDILFANILSWWVQFYMIPILQLCCLSIMLFLVNYLQCTSQVS